MIDTPMTRIADEIASKKMGIEPGEWARVVQKTAPLKLIGQSADVAALVSYLVSPAARFITDIYNRPNNLY
jgi:NAD(P)-dependent dehydrogenase (short-subunit alcohol dehydrogenase family)